MNLNLILVSNYISYLFNSLSLFAAAAPTPRFYFKLSATLNLPKRAMLIGCRGLICFFYYFFACLSPAGEDEQQQLEDGHPGGVRRRRTDRV